MDRKVTAARFKTVLRYKTVLALVSITKKMWDMMILIHKCTVTNEEIIYSLFVFYCSVDNINFALQGKLHRIMAYKKSSVCNSLISTGICSV